MGGLVLEIASGTGEHAVHIANAIPNLRWQPTDPDREALASIEAWRNQKRLANLLPPLQLNAAEPNHWPVKRADAIVNINMIHISPWAATIGLMKGASHVLPPGGKVFLYGPYFERDVVTEPSNLEFDLSLKTRNPAWGIRHVDDVSALAREHCLTLVERIAMPANNLILIFKKI